MRFANLLRATRLEHGSSFRSLVKAGAQQWTKDQLKQIEEGLLTLDEATVESVSMAYGADLASILPSRLAVDIVQDGVISAGGVRAVFIPHDETSLLTAYLRLIRSMRRQRKAPMIALRRDDIDVLAAHLDVPGERVIDRLTSLMGATLHQRTAIASMFAMGAVVIGLAGATVAGAPERSPDIIAGRGESPASVVATAQATDSSQGSNGSSSAVVTPSSAGTKLGAEAATAGVDATTTSTSTSTVVASAAVPPASVPAASTAVSGSPTVAVAAPPVAPQTGTATPSTVETNAGDPPLVPTTPTTSEPIVATDDPPVPPTTVDPGSAEPPLVPADPPTTTTVVDVGPPPVPGG